MSAVGQSRKTIKELLEFLNDISELNEAQYMYLASEAIIKAGEQLKEIEEQ